ncbi:MAG: hypothetical protein DHS20C14_07870 [Phycisphaeraceae bacterium]|nr:MAG: hypothetical protein DHS20C14_07870 [Phycisphaeraceae bacterium]
MQFKSYTGNRPKAVQNCGRRCALSLLLAAVATSPLVSCGGSVDYPAQGFDGVAYADFADLAEGARPALLLIGQRADGSMFGGNGVALAPDLILTAEHVGDDEIIRVGHIPVRAEMIAHGGFPEVRGDDWALLRIEPPVPESWVVGLGPEPKIGDALFVRGVLGARPRRGGTLFAPFEGEARAVAPGEVGIVDDPGVLVLDLRVWRSLSGAPVLDLSGRVVGVLAKAHHKNGRDAAVARRLPRDAIARAITGEPATGAERTGHRP